jgi:hypothetical protein
VYGLRKSPQAYRGKSTHAYFLKILGKTINSSYITREYKQNEQGVLKL